MKTYIADYHTHTRFSCDSDAAMESMCLAALKQEMDEIAITDHADFEPLDTCCGHFRPAAYWAAIEHCRATFDGSLTIRAGVECGEGHIYSSQIAAVLAAREYDVVLGSIHWVQGRPTFSLDFFDELTLHEGLVLYFDELAHLAAQADYDVLAHIDIIRRAVSRRFGQQTIDLRPHESRVRRVMRTVAERGKGIEINTSYGRKGMGAPGPSVHMLRWFREEGGQIVTLGSDSHAPEEVGSEFDRALAMVQEAGFEHLATFEHRRPTLQRIAL